MTAFSLDVFSRFVVCCFRLVVVETVGLMTLAEPGLVNHTEAFLGLATEAFLVWLKNLFYYSTVITKSPGIADM